MRILVTGGAGFIGSNFIHLTLSERPDSEITVLDKLTYAGNRDSLAPVADRITLVEGDIADADLVDRLVAASDLVVHFAARPHLARSHSIPSTFTSVGIPRALRIGSQKPFATFITSATSGFFHAESAAAVRP